MEQQKNNTQSNTFFKFEASPWAERRSLPTREGRGRVREGGGWVLFIELVIITVVAWAVLDPAVVNLYYRYLPLGYDSERLLYGEYTVSGEWTTDEDGQPQDPYRITEQRRQQMKRQLEAVEGVASAYVYDQDYDAIGYTHGAYSLCVVDKDSIFLTYVGYVPDSRFFETYGLRPLPGSPSAEELSHIQPNELKVVVTRSGAIALFGTTDVVGRRCIYGYGDEAHEVQIAGVVEDFRKGAHTTNRTILMRPGDLTTTHCHFVLRLQKGKDAHRFVEEHGAEVVRSGKTAYSRVSRLIPFTDWLRQQELDDGRTQKVNQSLALAFFFLVNLVLAVVGTVWLHAKRRTEECGVRRAFGATRGRLLCDMLWRNALMATVAVLIGLVIYLNYAYSGLEVENGFEYTDTLYTNVNLDIRTDLTWVNHFWSHFLVISACVYLIILGTVLIGTAIPAWRITRTNINEALKDE